MFPKKFFSGKKVAKGFTLVEIIVVLVILAILAVATIPSMLGFMKDAKQKSLTGEVRAVYTVAQAYITEHFEGGEPYSLIASEVNGEMSVDYVWYNLLQNDASERIFKIKLENGKMR